MSKPKAAPPQAKVDADAARVKLKAAKEAVEKNKTAATEKALETAKAAMSTAAKAENRDRWKRVGGPRVAAVIVGLKNIGKMTPATYEYDEGDVAKAEAAIRTAFSDAMTALRNAKTKTPGTKASAAVFEF